MSESWRRVATIVVVLSAWVAAAAPAVGASRVELTWLPCGSIRLPVGSSKVAFHLPRDYAGVIHHPMILLAFFEPDPNVTPIPMTQPTSFPAEGQARLIIRVGDRKLPDWIVTKSGSAYVVNLATIKASPQIEKNLLELDFFAEMQPGWVSVYGLGAPDPLVVSDALDGPLQLFAEKAPDAKSRALFDGLIAQFAARKEDARAKFTEAAGSDNEKVAMYARRSLRLLKSLLRTNVAKEGFASRYRWGLFLQQCGFFQAGIEEFGACLKMDESSSPAAYRMSEVMESSWYKLIEIAGLSERAGRAMDIRNPTTWNVLVTFLRKRTVQTLKDGRFVTEELVISDEDVKRLKEEWITVEKFVFGASRGTLKLVTAFHSIPDETQRPFVKYDGWLPGPPEDIIEVRGWFDSVISIRPHLPGERDQTGGGDVGPKGAALSDVGADADWQRMFRHFYHQLDWALIVGETGPGAPLTDDSVGCGVAPIPTRGYGLRAAMRYYMTPGMFRHVKIVPTVIPPRSLRPRATTQPTTAPAEADWDFGPPSYLRYWRVQGPVQIDEPWPEHGEPKSHVLDPVPTTAPVRIIDSASDFIDLKREFGNDGWMLARAECWVWSRGSQHVQMWIGQNDRVAVWVNGRCVHQGRYASTCNYLDKDQVDEIASYATLEPGWNRIEVAAEGWPAPRNRGWGFSIRFATFEGLPIPGLRFSVQQPDSGIAPAYVAPETGYYYSWTRCESAYHEMIPQLSEGDLAALTNLRGMKVHGKVTGADGMIGIEVPGRPESGNYRRVPAAWNPQTDRDAWLNNVLDWAREDTLAIRYTSPHDGHVHDLLIMKPEASEAYLTLLREPNEAAAVFGQLAPASRVVGYLPVPADRGSSRSLIVADVLLSVDGEAWPIDEEDLMEPEQK